MMGLKICGMRPGDDLSFTASPVVTHVGIVFVPASKRYVDPRAARDLLTEVHTTCRTVGVFSDLRVDEIAAVKDDCGIQIAQLHGKESVQTCRELHKAGMGVWKAFSVHAGEDAMAQLVEDMAVYVNDVDAILLDAAPPKTISPGVSGGHGQTFDWSVLPVVMKRVSALWERPVPIWVAGGLHPENVGPLVQEFTPFGVDVSSGVEELGRKSTAKITMMIKAVSGHE